MPVSNISVISTVAFKDAYLALLPAFEHASGHKVVTQWVPTVEVLRRIKAGEQIDLVLMAGTGIDSLTASGQLVANSAVPFVKSGIGIAVRAGAPRPDVSSADTLKHTLLVADSVAYSSGPSGDYLAGLFERLGIAAAIKPKTRLVQGIPVGELIARGEAATGFQQIPELLPVQGIQYLGPLPSAIQYTTVFAAGLHAASQQPDAARAWVQCLTSPKAAALYQQHGMEPA